MDFHSIKWMMSKQYITKRLILRQFEEKDALTMYKLNSDPEVLRFTGDAPFENINTAKKFLTAYSEYSNHGFGRWIVYERSLKKDLGWCGLRKNTQGEIDLGFRFFREFWGRGYATQSSLICLHIGFVHFKLDQIVGKCLPQNKASSKVLLKIGMEKFENRIIEDKKWLVYRILKDDFLKDSSHLINVKLESS